MEPVAVRLSMDWTAAIACLGASFALLYAASLLPRSAPKGAVVLTKDQARELGLCGCGAPKPGARS